MPYKSIDARRAANRKSYRKNATKVKASVVERKHELLAWWRQYKSKLVCMHCGENDPVCIDLHHVITGGKMSREDTSAGWAWRRGRSIARMKKDAEETCVPLCSNCHRKVHAMHRRILREQGMPPPADILDEHETL